VKGLPVSIDATLKSLGIELPAPPKPVASYVPAVLAGDLLFLSGILPFRDGQVAITGKLGEDVTVERGAEAARLALLNALGGRSEARARFVGSRPDGLCVSWVMLHQPPGFVQQPAVINGASDLLVQVFGEAGRHARVALGCGRVAACTLQLNSNCWSRSDQ
jgi:enamine deaminase RidA (YjgF/YER057c/UK114 family)